MRRVFGSSFPDSLSFSNLRLRSGLFSRRFHNMVSIQHSLSPCVRALVQTDVSMGVSVSLFFLCVFVGRGDLTMKMTPQTENSSTTSRTLASAFFDIGCRRRCCWLLCRLLSACVSDLRASPANSQHRRKCHHPHRDRKEKKRVRLHPGRGATTLAHLFWRRTD